MSESNGSVREEIWDVSQFKVPPAEGKTRFHDFDLPIPLLHAIYDLGFEYCTPIQAEILPSTLSGKDASGRAQTGTGKTAAFLITVLTRLLNNPVQGKRKPGTPRVLILAPTRELVLQTAKGAALLAEKAAAEGQTPDQLAARVATPGGTTEAAFNVFHDRSLDEIVSAALRRAAERSRELSAG